MANYLGSRLNKMRKQRGISQRDMAELLTKRGIKVTNQAVSKWESGASLPNAVQFLIICDLLEVRDISGVFLGKTSEMFDGLNEEGRAKISEFASFVRDSGIYDAPDAPSPRGSKLRTLPVYNLEAETEADRFLDSTNYELVLVGNEVPITANFGVKVVGRSMEPDYFDGQIAWIRQKSKLENGDIGVFVYENKAYFKRLRDRVGGVRLQSLNVDAADVIIAIPEKIRTFGVAIG